MKFRNHHVVRLGCWIVGNSKMLYFFRFFNFDNKFVFSRKYTPYVNFLNLYSKCSKSDKFAWKQSMIIHEHFWSQKLSFKTDMTKKLFLNIFHEELFSGKTLVPIVHCKSLQPECNWSAANSRNTCNFLSLQLLFAIFAYFWLQIKRASFKCKNYVYYLLHPKDALL